MLYHIIDCEFNRKHFKRYINMNTNNPPPFAIVQSIVPYRKWSCWQCHTDWMAAVKLSTDGTNISGEQTEFCPECHNKASIGTAWIDHRGNEWSMNHPMIIEKYPDIDN